ncbi:MAG: SCP2 sterol-binding domain-containing protein [Sulfuricella sp.]|nr:SCP2 sterol-binding domain-containing protein [Sulfuricella sp.]
MEQRLPTLPKQLGKLLSLLPRYPNSLLFAQTLNLALGRILPPDALLPLHGKLVCISVKDAGMDFHFTLGPKGFVAITPKHEPDLTIRATAYDFFMLATRREDPDTLFFSRRLVIEGDTELGLFTKNTLDALDLPLPDISLLAPDKVIPAVISRLLKSRQSAKILPQ